MVLPDDNEHYETSILQYYYTHIKIRRDIIFGCNSDGKSNEARVIK